MEATRENSSVNVDDESSEELYTERHPLVRFQPKLLTDVVLNLSSEQKVWITNTGFGFVLRFNLEKYPHELSYFFLKSYEPNQPGLRIYDRFVNINDEDVHDILGLPIGENNLQFSSDRFVLDEWRSQFEPIGGMIRITAKDVCNAITNTNIVDERFKKNFLVLLSNIFIQASSNPYISQKMVQFTGNIDQCLKYNWCRYLLTCLQDSWMQWNGNPSSLFFKGSLAFLIYFCLERFTPIESNVPRLSPRFTNWSDNSVAGIKVVDFRVSNLSISDEDLFEANNEIEPEMIVKKVCEDIDLEFQYDLEATPEILLTNLKEALDKYTVIQRKCMEQLMIANNKFPRNDAVQLMMSKFTHLNDKAICFVSKRLVQPAINSEMRDMITDDMYIKPSMVEGNGLLERENGNIWKILNVAGDDVGSQVVFKWKEIIACKVDFQSMNFGEMIMTSVIDIWSCVLNLKESLESNTNKKRVFAFTQNTLGIVNVTKRIPFGTMFNVFEENMDHILNLFDVVIETISLVFFPMFISNHHYVVCYNLDTPSVEILDNRSSFKSISEIYGDQIDILHMHFTTYLKNKGHRKSMAFRYSVPERLIMNWQTKYNDVDCGVFSMMHMKTYIGGGANPWTTTMGNESYTQMTELNEMRTQFVREMLLSPYNEIRGHFYVAAIDENDKGVPEAVTFI